jgi:hypothetical protein
MHGWRGRYQLS